MSRKFFIVIALSTYTLVLLALALRIAENRYFDKLFYRKSWLHGYYFPNEDGKNILSKFIAGINSEGYRDRKFVPKKKNEFLVMIVGDSNVWGMGIRKNQRFTNILEKRLSRIRPTRIISLAQGGTNLFTNLEKAREYEKELHPDLIVFTFYENDLTISPWQKDFVDRSVRDNQDIVYDFSIGDPEEEYKKKVLGSYDEATANFQLFLKLLPELDRNYLYYILTYHPWQPHESYVKTLMSQSGLNVVDNNWLYESKYSTLADIKNDKPKPSLSVSKKEGHPNALAHRMFAERLFQKITCNPGYGFSNECRQFDTPSFHFSSFLNPIRLISLF